MKIAQKSPDPFYYQGNNETGILLIHGFTGSPAEMKLLGGFLNQKGYTVYAPLLAGHGITPEEMIKTNQEDWWNSVEEAYDFLKEKGYLNIIAIGLSMGGILSLKLAYHRSLKAVVAMAAPIFTRDRRMAWTRWFKYIKRYQIKEKKEKHIDEHLVSYDRTPIACVERLYKLIKEVKAHLSEVNVPALIMQGQRDETVIIKSASYIYDHVSSPIKEIRWYEQSTHIMTLDHEREEVFQDILTFIEKIHHLQD